MGIYRKGDSWFIDYYVGGYRKREKIGPSRKLAETVLAKRKIEIAENKYLDIRKEKKISFEYLAETFLNEYCRPNHRTYKRTISYIKNLSKFFGNCYISEISPLAIEKYKSSRIEKVKPATVNRDLDVLRSMFNRAIEWGMMKVNPAQNVKRFSVDNTRVRFLTEEEIKRLLEACSGDLLGIVILALNTGMRRGEIFGLRWEYIDLENGIINLPGSLSKNKRHREIPMNELVIRVLKDLKAKSRSGYVFPGRQGNEPRSDVRKSFALALKKAGIENFRFHDLRHTFCSQLVASGVDIYTVMELAGHRSVKMTMRYAHLAPSKKKEAVKVLAEKMDTFWTPEPEPDFSGQKILTNLPSEKPTSGPVAQLGERLVRNEEVVGSNPIRSTSCEPEFSNINYNVQYSFGP